jgi:serine/threonine protein kinase
VLIGRAAGLPFEDENEIALFRKIRHVEFAFPPVPTALLASVAARVLTSPLQLEEVPLSGAAKALIRLMLTPAPAKRITTHRLLDHPWLAGCALLCVSVRLLHGGSLVLLGSDRGSGEVDAAAAGPEAAPVPAVPTAYARVPDPTQAKLTGRAGQLCLN